MDQKRQATPSPLLRAAFISALLSLAKFVAFVTTGSLTVLTSFLDSSLDTIISFTNSRVQAKALSEADSQHPFGHGGFEVVSALVQGIAMMSFGFIVIFEAVAHILNPVVYDQESLVHLLSGFFVLLFAAFCGYLIHFFLLKHQREHRAKNEFSLSLEADSAHYLGDVWLNLFAALGVGLAYLTELSKVDYVCAAIGGILFFKTGLPIFRSSIHGIVDRQIDPQVQQQIVDIIKKSHRDILGIHRLRTRQSGPILFADFHLKLEATMSLEHAHEISEIVESNLKNVFPNLDIIIHLDPHTEPDDELWQPEYES